jgi:hypothetical protein
MDCILRRLVVLLAYVVRRVHQRTTTESTGVELFSCGVADAFSCGLREEVLLLLLRTSRLRSSYVVSIKVL